MGPASTQYLLIANNVGEVIAVPGSSSAYPSYGKSATDATNNWISKSAAFIKADQITTNTVVYDPSTGALYDIQFWTYGTALGGKAKYMPFQPSGFTNMQSANYIPSLDIGSLSWTIVGVSYPLSSTTSATVETPIPGACPSCPATNNYDNQIDAILGLCATIFILGLATLITIVMNKSSSAPMSTSNDHK
jgi:hypothetical protein